MVATDRTDGRVWFCGRLWLEVVVVLAATSVFCIVSWLCKWLRRVLLKPIVGGYLMVFFDELTLSVVEVWWSVE